MRANGLPGAMLSVASVALMLAACTAETPAAPSITLTPGPTLTPTVTSPPTVPASSSETPPAVPEGLTPATVTRVVDGDTIDVLIDGTEYRVRYIGIDTPETVAPGQPVECFGREASQRNRELVEGETIGLEKDVSETDRFGRLLRYVWLPSTGSGQGEMVNATLVKEGYALASTFPPDVKYAETFAALQAQAREAARGLWGDVCTTPAPTLEAGECEYSGTSEPVIKGNISQRTGERIYHVPGGEFYDATVVDEAAGERWFCTEFDAIDAGWRKSLR